MRKLKFLSVFGLLALLVFTLRLAASPTPWGQRTSVAVSAPTPSLSDRDESMSHSPGPTVPVTATLPSLPSLHARSPDLYDEDGCAPIPPGEGDGVRCGPSREDLERLHEEREACIQVEAGAPDLEKIFEEARHTGRCVYVEPRLPSKNLAGFRGPYYTADLEAGEVVVLKETLTTVREGSWQAWGLVRNETSTPVGEVNVTASLIGAGGAVLDRPSAEVPVDPLRPGEPGPFVITSTVDAARVTSLEWLIVTDPPNPQVPPGAREVELLTTWTLPIGAHSAQRSGWFLENMQKAGLLRDIDTSYILKGTIDNWGEVALPEPKVVAAWLDDEGRVVWVEETAPLGGPDGPASRLQVLEPGGSGDFGLGVSDPEVGPRLDELRYMLWGVGG